jgi:hypothetical protein
MSSASRRSSSSPCSRTGRPTSADATASALAAMASKTSSQPCDGGLDVQHPEGVARGRRVHDQPRAGPARSDDPEGGADLIQTGEGPAQQRLRVLRSR